MPNFPLVSVLIMISFISFNSQTTLAADMTKEEFLEIIQNIESSGNADAVGRAGEVGLFQIHPITLEHFNKVHGTTHTRADLFNPELNARVASWYVDWLLDRPGVKTWEDVIIAWNWGTGNFRMWRKNFDSKFSRLPLMTQNYIIKYRGLVAA